MIDNAAHFEGGSVTTPAALNFIHRFLPGTSSRTLLLLHGTGGNEADLIQFGRALDSEAKLLSPRGKVSEDGMPRFFQRLAEGVFDEEDLIRRTHELADFIEQAAVHYGFDPQKAVAVGTQTARILPAPCSCSGPAQSAARLCCDRWYLSFRRSCPN